MQISIQVRTEILACPLAAWWDKYPQSSITTQLFWDILYIVYEYSLYLVSNTTDFHMCFLNNVEVRALTCGASVYPLEALSRRFGPHGQQQSLSMKKLFWPLFTVLRLPWIFSWHFHLWIVFIVHLQCLLESKWIFPSTLIDLSCHWWWGLCRAGWGRIDTI